MRSCRIAWTALLIGLWMAAPWRADAQGLPEPTPIDRKFAILGITIGQTPEQVAAALKAAFPDMFFNDGTHPPPPNGQRPAAVANFNRLIDPASGKPYAAGISASVTVGIQADRIQAAFSAPASGNRAFSIIRVNTALSESKTPLAPLLKSLADRYGQAPVSVTSLPPAATSVFAKWSFDASGKVLPPGRAYTSSWCFAQSTEIRDGAGCGSMEFRWSVDVYNDREYASGLNTVLTDGEIGKAARAYDAAAAKKAHDATVGQENSKGSGTKL